MSSITNQGEVRLMLFQGELKTTTLITLMCRLIRDAERGVFLILDNLNVHTAAPVRKWIEKHSEAITAFRNCVLAGTMALGGGPEGEQLADQELRSRQNLAGRERDRDRRRLASIAADHNQQKEQAAHNQGASTPNRSHLFSPEQ